MANGTSGGGARGGLSRPVTPSPELAAITGSDPLPRSQVVSKMWDYIRRNKLQDPNNKRESAPTAAKSFTPCLACRAVASRRARSAVAGEAVRSWPHVAHTESPAPAAAPHSGQEPAEMGCVWYAS